MEWMPISKRIIKARFYSKHKKLMVIQAYAPTNNAMDEEKDEFYNQLQDSVASCSSHDMIVVIGDEWISCNWNSFLTLKKPLIKFTEKACGTSWEAMEFHARWRE